MEQGIVLTWGSILGAMGFILTIGVNVAIMAMWSGSMSARLKAVEGHAHKVDRIGPIEAELEGIKAQIGVEFKNLREEVRDLARAVHGLAVARAGDRARP